MQQDWIAECQVTTLRQFQAHDNALSRKFVRSSCVEYVRFVDEFSAEKIGYAYMNTRLSMKITPRIATAAETHMCVHAMIWLQ
jgi:hypothetical protein